MEVDNLERKLSWALPELPKASSCLYTWGRSDFGQTGLGKEESSSSPQLVQALKGKDIVHAAGSTYNSAFVTSEPPGHLNVSDWLACPTPMC
jgi:alpha-tubulin suppressor-like RCC1 family protein